MAFAHSQDDPATKDAFGGQLAQFTADLEAYVYKCIAEDTPLNYRHAKNHLLEKYPVEVFNGHKSLVQHALKNATRAQQDAAHSVKPTSGPSYDEPNDDDDDEDEDEQHGETIDSGGRDDPNIDAETRAKLQQQRQEQV